MDPTLIGDFVRPISEGRADYTKGNRFFRPDDVRRMPRMRLLGNLILSFMAKASSGYWHVFDPTDGYTAIHRQALRWIPLERVADGYFFESDMLFRLGILRAVVVDVPIESIYGEEESNLRIRSIFFPFLYGHFKALIKRIGYMYFLRNFSVATLELVLGLPALVIGIAVAIAFWTTNSAGRSADDERRGHDRGPADHRRDPAAAGVRPVRRGRRADRAAFSDLGLQTHRSHRQRSVVQ